MPRPHQVRGRRAVGLIALVCLLLVAWLPASARGTPKDSSEHKVPLPFALTIQGANGTSTVLAPVPHGSRPRLLTGTIVSTYHYGGEITVSVNGRRRGQVGAMRGGTISIPLTRADVVDGAIPVTMSVHLTSEEDCFADDAATAELRDAAITFASPARAPDTIAAFLSPGVPSYRVVTDADPSIAEQSAALDAAAALTLRFPFPTRVSVATDSHAVGTNLYRVVRVQEGDVPPGATNTLALTGGTLMVSGHGDHLAEAAIALANPDTDLIESATATDLTAPPAQQVRTGTLSWSDMGWDGVDISGVGQVERDIHVSQAMFGTSINALQLVVRGGVTALSPGGQGRVDLLWNGTIADTFSMGSSPTFQRAIAVPTDQILRDNDLTVRLSYVPPGGKCFPPGLAAQLTVDPDTSTVTVAGGNTLPPGFERFPQAIAATLPVGFGSGTKAQLMPQAGALITALQSQTPQQLVVAAMDEQAFTADSRPGLLVGGTSASTDALQAPLHGVGITQIGGQDESFTVGQDEPFAFLQGFSREGRDLVLLGVTGSDPMLADGLASYADAPPDRWAKLANEVVAQHDGEPPVALAVRQPPEGPWLMAPIIATAIVLVLLIALLVWWLFWRPRGPAPPLPGQP